LDGKTLSEIVSERGCMNFERALPIFVQACDALLYAHKRDVLHRDLKPSNFMIVSNGEFADCLKLLDFGIAKQLNIDTPEGQGLTRTGEVFGSPLYMSPEQCLGRSLDERSDIYSMGCVMYEVLTGKPPLVGLNALDTLHKHINEDPLPFVSVDPALDNLPSRLEELIFKALRRNPDDRYQTMAELLRDLQLLMNRIKETGLIDKSLATTGPVLPAADGEAKVAPRDLGSLSSSSKVISGTAAVFSEARALGGANPNLTDELSASNLNDKDSVSRTRQSGQVSAPDVFHSSKLVWMQTKSKWQFLSGSLAVALALLGLGLFVEQMRIGSTLKNAPIIDAKDAIWLSSEKQGEDLYRNGHYERALEVFRSAVRKARLSGGNDLNLASALNNLGSAYYKEGQYDEAETALKEALSIRSSHNAHPGVADSMTDLGMVYCAKGELDKAEQFLSRALVIRQGESGPKSDDVADSLAGLAALYNKQGRVDQAMKTLKQSLDIRNKERTPSMADLAETENNIATDYQVEGKLEEARQWFEKAKC
jgi:serine/threonine protein kinase/Tfp pilus assembly protein PilF